MFVALTCAVAVRCVYSSTVTNARNEPVEGKKGSGQKGQTPWSWTGKSKGSRPGAAIALPAHYGLDVLRPYHAEDGSILVKRGGATRDADLVSPEGLANRLTTSNTELLNRPGKGVTMLSGTIYHGLTAIQYAEGHPERNGLSQLHMSEDVVNAAKLLQEAQHSVTTPEDIKASVLTLLQYVAEPER